MGKGFHPLPVPVLEKGKALAKPHWRLRAPIPVAKMVSCRVAAGLGVSSCCGEAAVTCCGSVPSTKGFWGQGSGGLAGTIVVTQAPAWWGGGGQLARVRTASGGGRYTARQNPATVNTLPDTARPNWGEGWISSSRRAAPG